MTNDINTLQNYCNSNVVTFVTISLGHHVRTTVSFSAQLVKKSKTRKVAINDALPLEVTHSVT